MALGSSKKSALRKVVLCLAISPSVVYARPGPLPEPAPVKVNHPEWHDPFHPSDSDCPHAPYPKPFEPGPLTTRFIYSSIPATAKGHNITYAPSGHTGTYTVIVAQPVKTKTVIDVSAYTRTSYPANPADPWTVVVGKPTTTYITTEEPPYVAPFTRTSAPSHQGAPWTVHVGHPAPDYTSTRELPPGAHAYTSYIRPSNSHNPSAPWEVVVGSPAREITVTKTLPLGSLPFTSIHTAAHPKDPWTKIIGLPEHLSTHYEYLHDGHPAFTSTGSGGIVTVGVPVRASTVYTTVAPGKPAYTTTIKEPAPSVPWTVVIATPGHFHTITTTSILAPTAHASTVTKSGANVVSVIVETPAKHLTYTTTTLLPPDKAPFVSTVTSGTKVEVIDGVPGRYAKTTTTKTLPPGSPLTTSIVFGVSTITYIIGSPGEIPTTTLYSHIPSNSHAYTSYFTYGTIVKEIEGIPGKLTTITTSSTYPLTTGAYVPESRYTKTLSGLHTDTVVDVYPHPGLFTSTSKSTFSPSYTGVGYPATTVYREIGEKIEEIIYYPAPVVKSTTTVPHGQPAFTRTVTGHTALTVLYGVPSAATVSATKYLDPYTGGRAYTTTEPAKGANPATILYGIPEAVITKTVYGSATGSHYVRPEGPTPGTLYLTSLHSYKTIATYLDPITGGAPYTLTLTDSGPTETVRVGVRETIITITVYGPTAGATTIPPHGSIPGTVIVTDSKHTVYKTNFLDHFTGGPAYTITVPAKGSIPGTIIYRIPEGLTTETVYGPTAGVTTAPGHSVETIITTIKQSTVTLTTYEDPKTGGSAFTRTIAASGSHPATILHGDLESYKTVTSYLSTRKPAYSSTVSAHSSVEGTVIYYYPTSTVTEATCGPSATTITIAQSGSVPATVKTVFPTPVQTCNNIGWEYGIYSPLSVNNTDNKYSSLNIEQFYTAKPNYTGAINNIYINTPSNPITELIYGSGPIHTQDFAIQHRGYLYAGQTGSYEFYNAVVDDAAWLWLGPNAFTGYTKTNAVLFDYAHAGANNYTQHLTAGTYYPIRLLYVNGQLNGNLDFHITAPNGQLITSKTGGAVPGCNYIVQFSCDRLAAPPCAPFGHER